MSDIVAERSGNILSIQLNRPAKKNAMTSSMYITVAELLDGAAKNDEIRVVLWHAAGNSFSAGNDIEDFMKNPPAPGESPQAQLIHALINFEKPLVAAVQGAAIGGGTTMLAHCDFVYAGESAKFQLPFVNLALVPEFGSSYLFPLRFGYTRAAELILLGGPFGASRAAELGLVTQIVPDQSVLGAATETARTLAKKSAAALQASKRLMKRAFREQLEQAVKLENEVFAERVRSEPQAGITPAMNLSTELGWGTKGELGDNPRTPPTVKDRRASHTRFTGGAAAARCFASSCASRSAQCHHHLTLIY